MFFLIIISFILAFYLGIRVIVPLSIGILPKIILFLVILAIAMKNFIIGKFFGGLSSPVMPPAGLLIAGWLYAAFIFFVVLQLLRDVLIFLTWILHKAGLNVFFPFSNGFWAITLTIAAILLSGCGVWQGTRNPDIKSTEIEIPGLPAELDGLSIVQLSDIHISSLLRKERTEAIVQASNFLRPDLVFITGDIVDGQVADRKEDTLPLKDLRANYGVYACTGNHEHYSDFWGWKKEITQMGITILMNQSVVIQIKNQPVVIAGVFDPVAEQFGQPAPNPQAALAGMPKNAFKILLAHQPKLAPLGAAAGFDLQLSGHTHGGQIFGLNLLVGAFNESYIYGIYRIDSMIMYVSSGAGLWNGLPIRLGMPAEISHLILRAKPGLNQAAH